jgi:hypothetical protein
MGSAEDVQPRYINVDARGVTTFWNAATSETLSSYSHLESRISAQHTIPTDSRSISFNRTRRRRQLDSDNGQPGMACTTPRAEGQCCPHHLLSHPRIEP